MLKNELSERALFLTGQVINIVPAHYTIWLYRYKIISNLIQKLDKAEKEQRLQDDLHWCGELATHKEKCYQIWHYRQLIVELLIKEVYEGDKNKFDVVASEYPIISTMMSLDEKNYHVWSYRRWLVEAFDLFSSDLEWCFNDNMISTDIRNNSAWSFRFTLLFGGKSPSSKKLESEIEYTKSKINLAPTNISSWNYLRGIYKKTNMDITSLRPFVQKFTEKESSIPAFELLVDIFKADNNIKAAGEIYDKLSNEYDPIRARYWSFKKSQLQ